MIEILTVDGKDYPFTFNYSAIKYLIGKTKIKDFLEILQDIELYDQILWIGLKQGYKVEKKKFDLTIEDAEDLLNSDFGMLTKIANLINVCMVPKGQKKEDNKEIDEKKQ